MGDEEKRDRRKREREAEMPRPLAPDATDPHEDAPHHALTNPADEADPTEFPDPYERRPDPRGPEHVDSPADAADEDEAPPGGGPPGPSTSEPHPPRNYDDLKPAKGDK